MSATEVGRRAPSMGLDAEAEIRLDSLASAIREHHQIAYRYATVALERALAAGAALREAREMVPEGRWKAWLAAQTNLDPRTASLYVRVSTFREELAAAGVTSLSAARKHVRDNGLVLAAGPGKGPASDDIVVKVLELQGTTNWSNQRIAREVGLHSSTVKAIGTGTHRRGRRRQAQAKITDQMVERLAGWLRDRAFVPEEEASLKAAREALIEAFKPE